MLHLATSVARPNLVSLGTCFGKFSKTGKFKLGITCLDYLAKYAKYKVRLFWLFNHHLYHNASSLHPLFIVPFVLSLDRDRVEDLSGWNPGLVGVRIWCRILRVTEQGTDEKTHVLWVIL